MSKLNIAYVRVSTTAQLEGNGPAQQESDIRKWAAMTGTTIDELVVEDETGTEADREKILVLRARATAGEIATIVISQMSRLGRELWVSEYLFKTFEKLGVEIISASEKFDRSRNGVAMRQMVGVFAQLQKSELLDRMKVCRHVAVVKRGTTMGGMEPYGYKSTGKGQLAIDGAEARLVARAFALAEEGHGLSGVARALAAEGFRTRKGTFIAPMQVSRMLAREAVYRGEAPVNHVELDPGVKPAQPKVLP